MHLPQRLLLTLLQTHHGEGSLIPPRDVLLSNRLPPAQDLVDVWLPVKVVIF